MTDAQDGDGPRRAPIERLPAEIFCHFISYVEHVADLSTLGLASRTCRAAVVPHIFHTVHIDACSPDSLVRSATACLQHATQADAGKHIRRIILEGRADSRTRHGGLD